MNSGAGYRVVPCRAGITRLHQKMIMAGRKLAIMGASGPGYCPVAVVPIQLVAELHLRGIRQILRIELKDQILEARRQLQFVTRSNADIIQQDPGQLGRVSGRKCRPLRIGMNQTFGGGKPQAAIPGSGGVWLSYAKTFAARHTVSLAQQDVIQPLPLLLRQFFQLLSPHTDDTARSAHPQKSLAVIDYRESGVAHHAVERIEMKGMVAL